MNPTDLIKYIDYTSLNFNDDENKIEQFTQDALEFDIAPASVCVYAEYATKLVSNLSKSNVKSCVVACGFPTGKMTKAQKISEITNLVAIGVDEIDIVLPYDAQRNPHRYQIEISEIKALMPETSLKVIIESGSLTMKEIENACDISLVGGADFIKTSTGKNGIGATEDAVRVISNKIKEHYIRTNKYVGVKVSGGIRTVEQAKLFKDIVKNVLGEDWMNPLYFRIGASSLIKNIFS